MYYQQQARFVWRCAGGNHGCPLAWPGHPEMELALGIKLCLQRQQEALETTVDRGRLTYRCPRCNDTTLASEWTEVIQNHYKTGGYNPEVTHQRSPRQPAPFT